MYKGILLSGVGASSYIAVSLTAYDDLNSRLPRDRASCAAWWYPAAKIGTGAAAGLAGQVRARGLALLGWHCVHICLSVPVCVHACSIYALASL